MTAINNDLRGNGITDIQTGDLQGVPGKGSNGEVAPEVMEKVVTDLLNETPSLPAPKTDGKSPMSIMGMDEETVMQMLGTENAEASKKNALSTIKAKAAMRQSQNLQVLHNLEEQAEKIKNQSIWDKLKKAFTIIGAVIGIVAGIAGAVFSGGSTLAITGACIGTLLAVESIVSTATDGKISLSALCTEMFGEKAGPWVAFGLQMALVAVTLGTSIKSAASSVAQNVEKMASSTAKTIGAIRMGTNIASGAAQVTSGIVGIGSAVNKYQLDNLKVSQKELEAMMAKIASEIQMQTKFLEEVLDQQQAMVEGVKDIIEQDAATTSATVNAAC